LAFAAHARDVIRRAGMDSHRKPAPVGGGAAASHTSRLRTAAAILLDVTGVDGIAGEEQSPQSFDDSIGGGRRGRSEAGSSEVSSHLLDPTWRRLLKSMSKSLSTRLSAAEGLTEGKGVSVASTPSNPLLEAALLSGDGGGGGSEADFENFLGDIFECLQLKDRDSGHLLLLTYFHLQPEDVPLSARTWRPLLVTALNIGAIHALPDCFTREVARKKLAERVRHWWSNAQINAATEAFRARTSFAGEPRRSDLAKLYFDLRENGLRLAPQDSDCGSSECMAQMSFKLEPQGVGQTSSGPLGARRRVEHSQDSRMEDSSNLYDITESSVSLGNSSVKQSMDSKDLRALNDKSIMSL